MRPTVSVIIPNYNYARFLPEAVESVLAQTYACAEIIVVDDGSTDDSLKVIERYADRGVKLIRQQNSGVGRARNAGAENSTGEIIAFLDADDIWSADKIEKQVALFQTGEQIALVSCGMQEFGPDGNKLDVYMPDGTDGIRRSMLLFQVPQVCSGSAIAVRRSFFARAGGFDERKEMHPSEDWEFYFRMAGLGKIAFVPEPLVNYRNHGGNGHLNIPRMERSVMLALEKIFADAAPDLQAIKRQSYANIHFTLSGSYLHAGNRIISVKHAVKSLRYEPGNLGRLIAKVFKRRA